MKVTLLAIVQEILSDMSSDEVNSISDTVESMQVAMVVRSVFNDIIADRVWPSEKKLLTLTGLANTTRRTHVAIESKIEYIDSIKYNKRKSTDTYDKYSEVVYLTQEEFLSKSLTLKSDATNVEYSTDPTGIQLLIRNDKPPSYWTSFDDNYIVFDSYDSGVESTIQSSKIIAYGEVEPVFSLTDTYVPDLPSKAFPFLIAEAKSTCFNTIKQAPNAKEEQRSRRQRDYLARTKWKTKQGISYPNYGRK